MTKASGLGANFYVDGYDLSGDVGALSRIGGGLTGTQDVTGINKLAFERIGLLRDGGMEFTGFFNAAAGQAHPVLSTLPTTDRVASYFNGTALGDPCASVVGKQLDYTPTRAADGSLTVASQALANGYGLEWGESLTAGIRTDTAATNGTAIDFGAVSTLFGAQAYLHVFTFTGTDVTVKIQDSANNSVFADVTGLTFTQTTAARTSQRIATAAGATVRRYVRAATVTTGGVTSVSFAVQFSRNTSETVF